MQWYFLKSQQVEKFYKKVIKNLKDAENMWTTYVRETVKTW